MKINKLVIASTLSTVLGFGATEALNCNTSEQSKNFGHPIYNNLTQLNNVTETSKCPEQRSDAEKQIYRSRLIEDVESLSFVLYNLMGDILNTNLDPETRRAKRGEYQESERLYNDKFRELSDLVKRDINEILDLFQEGDEVDKINAARICELIPQLGKGRVRLTSLSEMPQGLPQGLKNSGYSLVLSQEPNLNYLVKSQMGKAFGFQVVDGKMYKL